MPTLVSTWKQRGHELIDLRSNGPALRDRIDALSLVEVTESGGLGVNPGALRTVQGLRERNESSSSPTCLEGRFQTAFRPRS